MKKKIQKVYQAHGYGFPVTLLNVPMMEFRGEWVPNINQKALTKQIVKILVFKESRLTGSEVRFLRHFAQMTLEQFANRFHITHPAVLKWERSKNQSTGMNWATEKDIRLFTLSKVDSNTRHFFEAYEVLIGTSIEKTEPIKIDLDKKSA